MERWRLYTSGPGHPFYNMALDEVLLSRTPDAPVLLRLYTWDPPGLSLGYFQRFEELADLDRVLRETGAVATRRMTGGDAILHVRELTFSVVGREGRPPFEGTVESSYHRIHRALAAGFRTFGIDAELRGAAPFQGDQPGAAGRCFYRVTRYDLVAGGRKLVGSAQRRVGGRVLHHGSIPLDTNPLTPAAASLSGLAGRVVPLREAVSAVHRGFASFFGIRFETWTPPAPLRAAAERLAVEKYGALHWIRRR